ncbi:MAG: amino acid ABC transporter substrate-binding protein [Gemmatimonadetes bacterium]|nr:amino acid ABC transporter substrate-binding protein [Gemmatimonadota bacterium]
MRHRWPGVPALAPLLAMAMALVTAVAMALAVAACGNEDPTGPDPTPMPEPKPIVLGTAVAETGRLSTPGSEVSRGYRLAVEMLNEQGGIGGRKVQLVIHDDGSDADASVRLYQEMIASDSITAFLGPYGSGITEPVIGVTEPAGIPLVSAAAAAPEIWANRGRQWSVQMSNPGPTYLEGSVELAAQAGARTVALVWEDTAFPAAVAQGIRDAARTRGLDLVMEQAYAPGGADHEALAAMARDAGADLFIGGGYSDDAIAFARAVTAVQYSPLLTSLLLASGASFINEVGTAGRCVIGNAAWDPSIRTEGYIATNETFVRRYEAAYNKMPDYQAAGGFGAVELLAEGINRAATPTGEIDRASIRDFLFATSKLTVLGPFGVYPLGDAQAGAQRDLKGIQIQWQDDGAGGLVSRIVHPPEVSQSSLCFAR